MEEKTPEIEENSTSIVKIDDMSIDESQMAEQLYNSAGLDPVVDAGLKDYGRRLELENKLINKVFGTRGSDIRAYGESVAKRVALAIYTQLNRQYGGKVGDLRSNIMALEEARDRATTRYDDLMGRVVGILGDEYKELRTDSKTFTEKLTNVLGEDLKEARIDQKELMGRLADVDGLKSQIISLQGEKEQLTEAYESRLTAQEDKHKLEIEELKTQIAALEKEKEQLLATHQLRIAALEKEKVQLQGTHQSQIAELGKEREQLQEAHQSQIATQTSEHKEEIKDLRTQISRLNSGIKKLESEKTALAGDLTRREDVYNRLKTAISTLPTAIPYQEIQQKQGAELYSFILKDSKVPDAVIEGVGKFIDFKKYLEMAVEKGAKEAQKQTEEILGAITAES